MSRGPGRSMGPPARAFALYLFLSPCYIRSNQISKCSDGKVDGVIAARERSRKVRAPQGRVLGNAQWG